MANRGNINYNVRFNADTSGLNKATQEIQKIHDSLKAVRTINIRAAMADKAPEEAAKLKKELTEAKEAASLVESVLKKSFNTKLGTFNITNFKNELTKAGTSISEIGQKLMKSGAKGAAAFRDIETQVGKVNLKVKQSNKLLDEMATTMMNSIKWGVTSAIWNNMTGAVEKAWGFAKKLDSSLNDIRIVTEKSAEDMEKFAVQANKAAKTLGSSTTGYTEASLIYYQQGLSDAEVQARTETTLKAANVTGQSAAEVSEQLTAVWNGYKVNAQEAELYVDKLSAVAATTAADLEELSTGMSKVASAANIMGVDIDQLNAQLATVVSVTRQAPESVGTAFKTIYARMGDIEAGLDTETSLGEYTKKMSEMGFNVLDTNGKLKDMGSVIEEIGNKWTSLSREQQVALSQIMAGTRQYNNLLALFDNWDMYSKSIETSKNATGALQKQQDTYMESMEAHLQKLSTEGERVYNNLFNADTVNPLIDALTNLVSLIADFVDGIGGIGPLLLMIGSMGTKALSKQIGEGLTTSITNFRNAKKNAEELASQYRLLDSISKDFSNDLVGQQAKIDKSINSLARKGLITQERADELRSFSAALGETGKRIDNLKIKQEEYNKVAKEGIGNAQQLDKDSQGTINSEELLKQISQQRQTRDFDKNPLSENETLEDALPAFGQLNSVLDEQSGKIKETRENLTQLNSTLQTNIDKNITLSKSIKKKGKTGEFKTQVKAIDENIKGIEQQYKEFIKDLSEEETRKFNEQLKEYQKQSDAIRNKKGGNLSAKEIKAFQDIAQKIQKTFAEAIAGGFNDGLDNAEAAIDNVRQAAQQAAEGSLEQNQQELTSAEKEAEGLQQDFNDEIANERLKQRITLITELVGAVGQLISAMQMVSNIVNIAMDDSLSVEEKLQQIIPLIIAAVPIIISGFKGIQTSLAGLLPSGMAAAGGITAAGTASTAAGAAATGAAGGFAALQAAMGPIGWIILGVTAAVAGLTAIIKLATDAYNADAIAAEKAAKAYERASEAASQAEAAYTNLKDTLSKYDEQVKGLEELTEGTDEYKQAVQEANQAVLDLIANGEILASQVYRDDNGVLVISASAREDAQKKAEQKRNETAAAASYAHAESVAAQQKANKTASYRKQDESIAAISNYSTEWQFAQLRDEWIAMSQEKGGVATFEELKNANIYQNLYDDLYNFYKDISHDDNEAKLQVESQITRFYTSLADDIDSFVKESNNASQESALYMQEAVKNSLMNNADFTAKTIGQQSVIATQYAKTIDKNSSQYKELQSAAQTTVNKLSDDEIKKQFAEYMGYTIKEGKLFDSSDSEVSYSKENAKTSLVQKYIGANLKGYDIQSYNKIEQAVSQATKTFKNAGLDEQTGDAILNLLNASSSKDRNFDKSKITYDDYEQLMSMTEEDLNKLISNIDFSSFDVSADEFVNRIQEGLKKTDWSDTFSSAVTATKSSVQLINDALDDFQIGEQLDDKVISELEQKFPELTRIWDKTSKEYYDALRKAQEETEEKLSAGYDQSGKYEYGEIESKQEDYQKALENLQAVQNQTLQEQIDNAYEMQSEAAKKVIETAKSKGYTDTNFANWMLDEGASSEEMLKYDDARLYSSQLETINAQLQKGEELTEAQKSILEKDYSEALEKAADAAANLKNEVEDTFRTDYELEISITNDLLSDVDEIIDRAENARTAVELIGEGFKVSAEDSEELFTIFPELAHNAQVLADGTIQLDKEVTQEVLGNDALEIGSKTEVAAVAIDNRIAELEADKAAMEAQLENLHKTSVAEFDVQKFLGDNYQEFKEEEVNANALAAQDEVANSAASAKAVIANWQAKIQAAEIYAKVAAAAESPSHDTSGVENKNLQTFVNQTVSSTDTSNSVEMSEEQKKKKEEDLKQLNQKLYDLTEDYLKNKISSDEKQIAELIQSKSKLYASLQNVEAAVADSNIDLLDDVIDRYHDINILLDDMAKKIERVNKAQEHLIGADWLAAQEQGLKLLEEEIELRRQKQEIQQAEAVELQGHLLADGVKFFDDGSVANYAEIMIAQLAKVNQAQMSGNEDVAEAAEKNYEAFKENFERYEELRDEIEDLADEITDMMYEQISKKVEAFTAKLTVELDTTQAQKEWKEFTNQLFISANNALAQIAAQSEIYSANRNIATQTTGKYEQIVNEGIKAQSLVEGTAEEGTTSVYAQWSEELQQFIFDQAKWQEDMQASQQEAQEAILQILDDVDALGETAIGLLEDTIAAQKEQLAIYDDMNSLLNHSLKLQELFTGEKDYDAKGRIYAEQATIAESKARDAAARRNYALSNIDTYAQAYNEAKQKYDEAVANGTGDVTVLEKQLEITKQAYEDMKNELKESTDDFYSSIEEQIEAAKNVYVNTINKAMADMEKMFTGGKGLSYINEEWDLINKNAERYLDTVNSTYEVQALESKYIKAMDSTSNLSAQKKINKAMEEELKALREKDKLSQYDIDRANKKYELTMKQIALEEAQANKSTMRLRRDAQGNYSYQFVADEDEVSDAQQDLLAAQNDLYNFDKDRYQQTQDDILSIYQEYQQKMLEAAQINDPTERAEKEKLITEQYQQLLLSIAADNETARQNLGMSTTEALQGQYDINRSNFEAMTQGIFDNFSSVAEGMSTNFEMIMSNMITGWSGGVQSMIDKIAGDGPDGFKQQSQNAFNIAQQAAQEFDNKLTEIGENFSGEGNTADRILSDVQDINDKLDSFKTNVLDPTLAAVQTLIPDVWAEYKSGVDLAAESMNTLATKISSVYTNADSLSKKLNTIASQSPINVEVKYKTTGNPTNPSGGYGPNGGGEGGKISSQTSSQIGDTVVWGGDYALLNQDANNGNKMTNTSKTWNNIWDALDENERYDWDDAHWDGGDDEVLASAFSKWKITQEIYKDNKVYLYLESERDSSIGGWIPEEDLEEFSKSSEGWSYKTQSFDTGGYTGEWGSEGRMAMLHEKEIVLNQTDTANILDAVAIVRGIGDMLASLQSNWLSNLSSVQVPTISNSETNNSTAQTVNITAEFPNASSATEIEKALKNLVNIASQRAQAFK